MIELDTTANRQVPLDVFLGLSLFARLYRTDSLGSSVDPANQR
jgi:hypothetical protein